MVISISSSTVNYEEERVFLEPRRTFPQLDQGTYYTTGYKIPENLPKTPEPTSNIAPEPTTETVSVVGAVPQPGIEVIYECRQETAALQTEVPVVIKERIVGGPTYTFFRKLFGCVLKT